MRAGIERLQKRLGEVKQFDPQSAEQYNIPHVEKLMAAVGDALVRTFGSDSLDYERYKEAAHFDNGPHNYAYAVPLREVQQSLGRSKTVPLLYSSKPRSRCESGLLNPSQARQKLTL